MGVIFIYILYTVSSDIFIGTSQQNNKVHLLSKRFNRSLAFSWHRHARISRFSLLALKVLISVLVN